MFAAAISFCDPHGGKADQKPQIAACFGLVYTFSQGRQCRGSCERLGPCMPFLKNVPAFEVDLRADGLDLAASGLRLLEDRTR